MKLYIAYHGKDMVKVSNDLDCLPAEAKLIQWTEKYTAEQVLAILTQQGFDVCVDTGAFFSDYRS